MPAWLGSGEGPLPGCRLLTSPSILTWWKGLGKLCRVSFIRALIPFIGLYPHDLLTYQRSHLIPLYCILRFHHVNLEGIHSDHSRKWLYKWLYNWTHYVFSHYVLDPVDSIFVIFKHAFLCLLSHVPTNIMKTGKLIFQVLSKVFALGMKLIYIGLRLFLIVRCYF